VQVRPLAAYASDVSESAFDSSAKSALLLSSKCRIVALIMLSDRFTTVERSAKATCSGDQCQREEGRQRKLSTKGVSERSSILKNRCEWQRANLRLQHPELCQMMRRAAALSAESRTESVPEAVVSTGKQQMFPNENRLAPYTLERAIANISASSCPEQVKYASTRSKLNHARAIPDPKKESVADTCDMQRLSTRKREKEKQQTKRIPSPLQA
jgi:lipase chaperone LimK